MIRRSVTISLLICGLTLVAGTDSFAQEQKEAHVAEADPDGVQRVRVVAGSYFFKPNHIIVKVNVPVELVASRESGITPHNLLIRAREAGVVVEEDLGTDPKKIAFTATKVGKYPFYCGKKLPFVAGHRDKGMEGILEVVP
jgi:plastocyanin domain-containing protein